MSVVGKPTVRADGRAKVTGQARYSYEVQIPGVVYGVLVTSGVARGRIVDIDDEAARRERGVLEVITPRNALKLPGKTHGDPPDRVVQVLQDDRILFSNQPVAVVVADTLERATHAALLVRVHAKVEPHAVNLEDALDQAFPHDIIAGGHKQEADSSRGDLTSGLRDTDAKIDAEYDLPPETHNPMEPHATIAQWTAKDRLTVYDSSQWVFAVRNKLAMAFQIPRENVRVLTKFVGGAFGCKGSPWSHVLITALAAKQVSRPVKLVLARTQMFGPVGGRPQIKIHVAVAGRKNGQLTALRQESTSSTSRFDTFVEAAALQARHLYTTRATETKHRIVRLDIGTPTFMRAPGESSGSFALESALDELAHALHIDPLALRVANYAQVDPEDGKPFSSKSLRQCYDEGARRFAWRATAPRSQTRGGLLLGTGMATASYPANFSPANAAARMLADGTALVESGTIDLGTGTYTVMAQVAADALCLPYEKVRFDLGDSEMPEAPISAGSMTAASVASAVLVTCNALREKLIQLAVADAASPLRGARVADIRAEEGRLVAHGRSDSYADIVRRSGTPSVEVRSRAAPDDQRKKYSNHAFGAQFAEVLVDPALGSVRVSRMVGVFAPGRVLNARTARSQLMGGMVWGIGMALHEHAVYDSHLGRIMSRDLSDYHVPTNADVGVVEPYLIEEPNDPGNPAGVKGVGELGLCGAAAAIANAVFNATGRRVRRLPITPDKLL
ncbi:MAG TPA: xanthine dehydrogenase family protein molybdopterin-binding subunit [Myxococcales bacterium]|nr:xanthine dehydrogenase family protein molybdopterin-binding subunit [Myxococcales bacterium]